MPARSSSEVTLKCAEVGTQTRGCIDAQPSGAGGEAFIQRRVDGHLVLLVEGVGAGRIRLNDGGQGDGQACILQLAIDAHMIVPKGAGSKNSDVQRRVLGTFAGI